MLKNKKIKVYRTDSPKQTLDLAKKIAQKLKPGDIIYLYGELGSGKTVFVKGLGKELGVKEPIVSPSFVIVRQYQGRLPLTHIDLYRLSGYDAGTLPVEEYISNDGITAIEWADRLRHFPPGLRIMFRIVDKNKREIRIEDSGH